MTDAVFHPSLGVTDPYSLTSHWAAHGGNHVTAYCGFPRRSGPLEEFNRPLQAALHPTDREDPMSEAIQIARDAGERLLPLIGALPAHLAERLGFVRTLRPSSWVEVLFHLGWHFPDRGIEADRFRILSASSDVPWDFRCHEQELQLGGVRVSPDAFPGVIVSRLGEGSDFLTASVSALRLIVEALEGVGRASRPQPSAEFGRLRDTFLQLAEVHSLHPRELSARVLRLADSFRTPPATEWAGIERGGDGWGIPKYYVLSHLDANRVVCVLRGPGLETFQELADRAGAGLPAWPAQRYPALLNDVGAFARYCDPARFPWATHAGDVWNHGMVTDHRGNVERWLGLVFGLLMANRLEHLNLVTRPEDAANGFGGEPVNAMLALRGMNLFAASARAIELAGLLLQPPPPPRPAQFDASPAPSSAHVPPERTPLHPQTPLAAEIEQLLVEARRAYADPELAFTLVAIPCPAGQGGARMQTCEDDSPDAGEIREGVFYWPARCSIHFGSATFRDHGAFVFVAYDRAGDAIKAFAEFSGRAAAVLLAAAPSWASTVAPGAANTTWAATIMFIAPRGYAGTRPTGAHILRTPWAASITTLRDILVPPAALPPPPPRTAPGWDATARILRFLGAECKRFRRTAPDQETLLATFQEEEWPDAIDDPLRPGKLATTVESLNDRLRHIRFSLNGAGTGVCWRPV